jgi:lipopolysaccharide export system protein LptA
MFGHRFRKFVFFSVLCPFSAFTAASPNDAKEIAITSQAFEYNHTTGIAIYTGNVFAEQGTRKLWGDQLQIFRGDKGEIQKIVVTGLPAKLEQEGDIYKAPLIEYDPIKDTVRSPQNEKGQTTITLKPRAKS